MKKKETFGLSMKDAVFALGISLFSSFAFVPAAFAAERSAAQIADDAAITAQVKTRLLADETTRSININVDTQAGVVTLRGTVPTDEAKVRAESVAKSVDRVQAVANALIVGDSSLNPQTASAKAKEAAGDGGKMAGDAWITTKVKAALVADNDVKGMDINVSTNNGIVTLTGQVPTAAMRDKAVSIARNIDGVKKVNADGVRIGS